MRIHNHAGAKRHGSSRQIGLLQAVSSLFLMAIAVYSSGCCAPTEPPAETVATPTLDPNGGAHTTSVSVTIASATEGATIYYTIDGSDPDTSSTEYTAAIQLASTATVKARAYKDGMTASNVASAAYTITEATTYTHEQTYGSEGSGDDGFSQPQRMVVDAAGNAYVADAANGRVKMHDPNGNFVWETEPNVLLFPTGIALDSAGNIYVADLHTSHLYVLKLDPNGTLIGTVGSAGSLDGQFTGPTDVALDSADNLYVADVLSQRVQKFDPNGTFLTKWGSAGSGNGAFNGPISIAVDSADAVYVVDRGNDRIQKFDTNGNYLGQWGSTGTGNGQFDSPWAIAFGPADRAYVADYGNDRIQKFNTHGAYMAQWGSTGTADGQFDKPTGVGVDPGGYVYVVDQGNNRVQKFKPSS